MKNIKITDNLLNNSKISAYNIGQTVTQKNEEGKNEEIPYNPKRFPRKAIDIIFPCPYGKIEIFFDAKKNYWRSKVFNEGCCCGCLSPISMDSFFKTIFYKKMLRALFNTWPLNDLFYKKIFRALKCRRSGFKPNEPEIDEQEGGGGGGAAISAGGMSGGGGHASGANAIGTSDVLGPLKHGGGYMGVNDFHIPKRIGGVLRRYPKLPKKRKHKFDRI